MEKCQNCNSEMKPITLREWIDMWTGYACPGCHLATPEADAVEVADTPEPKKRKRKAKVDADAEVVESEADDGR